MKLSLFLFTICPINIIYYALYCCDNKVRLTRYQTLDFSNIYYPDRIEPMRRFESTVLIILFRFLARTHIGFNSVCSRDVRGRPNRSFSGPANLGRDSVSFLLVTTNVCVHSLSRKYAFLSTSWGCRRTWRTSGATSSGASYAR